MPTRTQPLEIFASTVGRNLFRQCAIHDLPCRAEARPTVCGLATKKVTRQSGFTLIEILVVITIISIIVSVAGYAVGGLGTRRLQAEARELVYIFNHLADQALIKQQTLRWLSDDAGNCQAQRLDRENTWQSLRLGNRRLCDFSAIKSLTLEYEGLALPEQEALSDEEQALYFLPTGDYTSFTLSLNENAEDRVFLTGDGVNEIELGTSLP